ncbi:MAG TPA: glycosyl hydrolase, partial [Phycisphaerae bacterium]|nr:glycosyl hydrolase [Phycisphaerae bacterium]
LRGALADWFTYTPGEEARYFAAYPHWGALVGFNESYYSFEFTDHHFHYGYFAMASALLGMYDPAFLADFGPMAELVTKEYANWDRTDQRFPYLRTFDPWRGHSYAGGLSSPGGNNQESSSEAIQSWAGMFLLGSVRGDAEMTAAGAMGYAIETEAMLEYWQDLYGQTGEAGNFSPTYPKTITGILFDSGQAYATYFSGDPAWIYGIQWLPISPAMNHLVRDPDFAAAQYAAMMGERDTWLAAETGEPNTISGMGTSLGNVVLGYVQLFDPDWVAEQLDALWTAEDPIARDNYTGGITYYFAHANRLLGDIQWDERLDVPTSQVYYNRTRDEHSYVAYNPSDAHRLATVTSNGVVLGKVHLPPRALTRATTLLTPGAPFAVLADWPADGSQAVRPALDEIAVVFSEPPAPGSLGAVSIAGPGVAGLTNVHIADGLIAVFDLVGAVEAGAEYAVTVPGSVASTGNTTLGADHVFTFTIEAAEPESAALVAHYRLDETSGTVARDAGDSHHDGTYVAAPTLGSAGADHATATSVRFNGSTQQVDLGEPTELSTLTNNFTVSVWIYPELFGGNRTIFGASWQDYDGWSLRLVGNRPALERLGPTQVYDSGVAVSVGAWTHVAAVYDAQNDVTFYIDGAAVATVPGDKPAGVATEPWFIGNNGTGEGIVGRVDDVQLYRRALSAADIAFLHDNPGRTTRARAADFDGSGAIDAADLAGITGCLTGPGGVVDSACAGADLDGDADVDLADLMILQRHFR